MPMLSRRLLSLLCLMFLAAGLGGCAATSTRFAPAGTLLVLHKAQASVALIDLASGREAARLAVGEGPHEVAISPDGRLAVVAEYGQASPGGSLSVIDIAAARVSHQVSLAPYQRPHGLRFIDARRVLVTAESQASLLVVDVQSRRVEQAIVTGQKVSHMVAALPGGTRAYVANIGSNNLSVLDLQAGTVLRHIDTGLGAEGVDISPDGREVWVSNRAADTLSVIDAQGLQVLASLPAPGFPIRVQFDPQGRRAFVSVPRDDALLVFDRSRRQLERRLALPGGEVVTAGRLLGAMFGRSTVPIGVVTDGSGRRVYVAQANADQVAEFEVDSGALLRVMRVGLEPDGLGWSPLRVAQR